MKKFIIHTFIALFLATFSLNAWAFWVWTPKSNKLVNPKYTAKDSPKKQYDWAMSFYSNKDYKRAAEEFKRLVAAYPNAESAPDAQYYAGLSYQKAGKYYPAFVNYQKVVDDYPFTDRIAEIVKAQYEIGEIFFNKHSGTLLGVEIMTDVERSIEIFAKVIGNMPYSDIADNAQYMIGLSYKKIQQYVDAVKAFEKLVQEYPKSDLVERARYEIAQCLYLSSLKAQYDQESTDEAMEEFEKYAEKTDDAKLKEEAKETVSFLKEKKAESLFNSAEFYEKRKKYRSAIIYYRKILETYPHTSYAPVAEARREYLEMILKDKEERKK